MILSAGRNFGAVTARKSRNILIGWMGSARLPGMARSRWCSPRVTKRITMPWCCTTCCWAASKPPRASRRASGRALPLDTLGHVPRHGDRTEHLALGTALDHREGHLDVEFAPALVERAGQRRAALQLHHAVAHCRVEAAPVRASQVLGNDQIETLAEGFLGGEAEQIGCGAVPADHLARA